MNIPIPNFIFSKKKKRKKGKARSSYDKMLIDWVRSGRTGKYLALGHGARTSLRLVLTPWPRAKYFPVRPSYSVNKYIFFFRSPFYVRNPKDGELLGLEWGMILQVSNIIFPDENSGVRCQYYKGSDKIWLLTWLKRGWKFFEFFVRLRVVVGK